MKGPVISLSLPGKFHASRLGLRSPPPGLLMLFEGEGGLILQFYKDKMKEFNLKVGPCSVLSNIDTEVDLNCFSPPELVEAQRPVFWLLPL